MNREEAIAAQKELKRLENPRGFELIAAKRRAYSEADSGVLDEGRTVLSEVANSPPVPLKEIKRDQTCMNEQTNNKSNETSVTQALHDMMVLTRLPTPQPSVF